MEEEGSLLGKSRRLRQPVHYSSVNNSDMETSDDRHTSAAMNRYKYYNRIAPKELVMPDHVVPSIFFLTLPIQPKGKQGSLITIFSIWNTMMGTSLLSMPWAIEQAGFVMGIAIVVVMAGLTLYTASLVLDSTEGVECSGEVLEFSDVCRFHLGRAGEVISVFFSLSALMGAAVVYWVLMTNFLYHTVLFIYQHSSSVDPNTTLTPASVNLSYAICPHPPPINLTSDEDFTVTLDDMFTSGTESTSTFSKVWDLNHTVPFFLLIFLAPLINLKSPTFFTKFNALGTFSVVYLLTFVSVKAAYWGINVDFSDKTSLDYLPYYSGKFPALSGTLALAYFIHNCVLSIMRNQKHPENNKRDLSIAYFCVATTYTFVGIFFYITYPLTKRCIEDNLLNNLDNFDPWSFVARICLLFQMITVFPLLLFIFRLQFMHTIFGSIFPSWIHVILLNLVIVAICIVFAVFYPKIGTIIRYSGALCGMAYIFTLPCVVHLLRLRRQGKLTKISIIGHSILILIGVANFVSQFVIPQ